MTTLNINTDVLLNGNVIVPLNEKASVNKYLLVCPKHGDITNGYLTIEDEKFCIKCIAKAFKKLTPTLKEYKGDQVEVFNDL